MAGKCNTFPSLIENAGAIEGKQEQQFLCYLSAPHVSRSPQVQPDLSHQHTRPTAAVLGTMELTFAVQVDTGPYNVRVIWCKPQDPQGYIVECCAKHRRFVFHMSVTRIHKDSITISQLLALARHNPLHMAVFFGVKWDARADCRKGENQLTQGETLLWTTLSHMMLWDIAPQRRCSQT